MICETFLVSEIELLSVQKDQTTRIALQTDLLTYLNKSVGIYIVSASVDYSRIYSFGTIFEKYLIIICISFYLTSILVPLLQKQKCQRMPRLCDKSYRHEDFNYLAKLCALEMFCEEWSSLNQQQQGRT